MGHLFQPDPPTPGPVVKISDDPNLPQRSDSEKAAFNANRDAVSLFLFRNIVIVCIISSITQTCLNTQ